MGYNLKGEPRGWAGYKRYEYLRDKKDLTLEERLELFRLRGYYE